MLSSDWSLVLFTILVQTAVGMLMISEIVRLTTGATAESLRWQAPTSCLLTALALLVSLSHLGTPTHSIFTILNVGSSWLSREILSVGGFFLLVLALTLLRRRTPSAKATTLALTAVIVGLAAIMVMSRVYLLETVPSWNTVATVLGFYGTVLLLGSVASGLVKVLQQVVTHSDEEDAGSAFGIFGVTVILGLTLKFVGIALSMLALSVANNYGVSGLGLITDDGVWALVLRIVLICAGTALFAWVGYRAMGSGRSRLVLGSTAGALILTLGGEIIGRLMFYGSYLRIGL